MHFSTLLIASAAFALAHSKVILTNVVYNNITAGTDYTIRWADNEGPVTLNLKGAQDGAPVTDPFDLATISVIGSGLTGTSYTWSVPSTIPQATYAIEIVDSGATGANATNYSVLWEVIDGVPTSTRSSSVTRTGSVTGSATESSTSTGTESAETASATESTTGTRSITTTASRTATSSTSTPTGTSAPAGGMASGLTSNLALVFVAAGALFMIN